MKVGVPTEIKTAEYRVALTPAGVRELSDHGHEVVIQQGAGVGSAIEDSGVRRPGREDPARRRGRVRRGRHDRQGQGAAGPRGRDARAAPHAVHLPAPGAGRRADAGLVDSGATCIAYETVEDDQGRLPLLAPMSEVAGKIATQAGARSCSRSRSAGAACCLAACRRGGRQGAGHRRRRGGDERRDHRARHAGGDLRVRPQRRPPARPRVAPRWRASTVYASTLAIEQHLMEADLVIGAVLVHGAKAPHVVTREQLGLMKKNAVLVDVSIDQGGRFETSRPTTHSDPTYEVDGITHYCVANMPGAVPITSTFALTNATMPYVVHVADRGARRRRRQPGAGRGLQRRGRQGDLRAGGGGDGPATRRCSRCSRSRYASEPRLAATVPRRMPTTSQLVRKGRKAPEEEARDPGLKSGKGRKKRVAALQRRGVCASTRPRRRSRTPRCARSPVCA